MQTSALLKSSRSGKCSGAQNSLGAHCALGWPLELSVNPELGPSWESAALELSLSKQNSCSMNRHQIARGHSGSISQPEEVSFFPRQEHSCLPSALLTPPASAPSCLSPHHAAFDPTKPSCSDSASLETPRAAAPTRSSPSILLPHSDVCSAEQTDCFYSESTHQSCIKVQLGVIKYSTDVFSTMGACVPL